MFLQALEKALDVQRLQAVTALEHTNGDVASAFDYELGRIQIDTKCINKLVLEYAGYR